MCRQIPQTTREGTCQKQFPNPAKAQAVMVLMLFAEVKRQTNGRARPGFVHKEGLQLMGWGGGAAQRRPNNSATPPPSPPPDSSSSQKQLEHVGAQGVGGGSRSHRNG